MHASELAHIIDAHRAGHTLPQSLYVSQDVFDHEMAGIFRDTWLFACNAAEIKAPGAWLTVDIGPHAIILVRGRDGLVRGFHNSCRHRGARICQETNGQSPRLICPYHQWTYNLDGSLLSARGFSTDHDGERIALKPIAVEDICGLIYICLADSPPPLDTFRNAILPYVSPHQLNHTKLAFASDQVHNANWKLIIENNRECYHCRGGHPELMKCLVEFDLPDAPDANTELLGAATLRWDMLGLPHAPVPRNQVFRCIRLPLNPGYLSFTLDGKLGCNKLLGDFKDPDLGSLRMFHAPDNWNHFLSDHTMHARVTPLSPSKTLVRTTWFVHEDAAEGVDYDPQRLAEVWLATNSQDGHLSEINHRGVQSSGYMPGPYVPAEWMAQDFSDWYLAQLRRYCDDAA